MKCSNFVNVLAYKIKLMYGIYLVYEKFSVICKNNNHSGRNKSQKLAGRFF